MELRPPASGNPADGSFRQRGPADGCAAAFHRRISDSAAVASCVVVHRGALTVITQVPGAAPLLPRHVTVFVQELRTAELYKMAGVSETLDWIAALVALDSAELEPAAIDQTLGMLLKNREDMEALRGERISDLLNRALARG